MLVYVVSRPYSERIADMAATAGGKDLQRVYAADIKWIDVSV